MRPARELWQKERCAALHDWRGGFRLDLCGLAEHLCNGDADLFGELAVLADVHSSGVDGFADLHIERGGIELLGVDGQQVVDAAERDGNDWHLSANGEIRRAGEEWPQRAVGGAAALRKNKKRHAGA